jgi:hypothetical protein
MVEIKIAGVQNRKILTSLLSKRLAAQNSRENKAAKDHQTGERKVAMSTAIPVAFSLFRKVSSNQGTSAASMVPASMLMHVRIVHTLLR